jgi:DNA-binding SARP family transcriptional activator
VGTLTNTSAAGPTQVRLLGPVDVIVGGVARPVHGRRRKAVLAVLALHPGEIVSTDRILDVGWSDTTPAQLNTMQSTISHLRRVLGRGSAIRAHTPGYVLDLGDEATDVQTAERMIARARAHGDTAAGAAALSAALRLWRDRPLADVSGSAWFDEQADRLDGVRRRAEQALLETRLALGEHERLVPELQRLAREQPFDERVHEHLMLALYRAGRQADALSAFRTLRSALVENLGIDAGPGLRKLEASILCQEPGLATPAAPVLVAAPSADTLLARGASALLDDGDLRAGRRWFGAARRAAESTGDGEAMAHAALGLGGLWVHEHRTSAEAALVRSWQRHALTLVDPRSALATRLRIRLAAEAGYQAGDSTRVLALLDESEDPRARMEALSLAHHCALGPDHVRLRRDLAAELITESARTGRRGDIRMALAWQTVDLFLEGHPHAERRLGELRETLAEHDHLAVGYVVSAIEVMLAVRAGRLAQAESLALSCARRGEEAGDADAQGWYRGQLVAIRWFQGRLPELLPALEQQVHSPTLSAVDNSGLAALATAAALSGDRRRAASALSMVCRDDLADLPRSSTWLVAMHGIAEASHLLGDATLAATVRRLLSPYAHLPCTASLAVACFGSAHHALGVTCLTIGDIEAAVGHLRAAVRSNLALAHWPALARSRRRYAQALALRGRPDDLRAAHSQIATATAEATLSARSA